MFLGIFVIKLKKKKKSLIDFERKLAQRPRLVRFMFFRSRLSTKKRASFCVKRDFRMRFESVALTNKCDLQARFQITRELVFIYIVFFFRDVKNPRKPNRRRQSGRFTAVATIRCIRRRRRMYTTIRLSIGAVKKLGVVVVVVVVQSPEEEKWGGGGNNATNEKSPTIRTGAGGGGGGVIGHNRPRSVFLRRPFFFFPLSSRVSSVARISHTYVCVCVCVCNYVRVRSAAAGFVFYVRAQRMRSVRVKIADVKKKTVEGRGEIN